MSANFITERSKYECKHGHNRVHIWVQTWSWNGPNKSAKFFIIGSKYECKYWNVPLDAIRPEMRLRNSKHDFRVCTHIWTLSEKFAFIFRPFHKKLCNLIGTISWPSLHSYMDPTVTMFALIFGPLCYEVCTHNRNPLWSSLHSYRIRGYEFWSSKVCKGNLIICRIFKPNEFWSTCEA